MHRVIIPVDFSEPSLIAARYAAQMIAGNKDAAAILYNNFETEDDRAICINYLENLKTEFLSLGVNSIDLEYEMGGELVENICRLAHTFRATLVVMGIKGHSAGDHAPFGSNTLKLIDKNLYPVLIIPQDAVFQGVNHVAFASDFENIKNSTPSVLINSVLEMFNPMLHIVNVNTEHYVSLTEEIQLGKLQFREMFRNSKMEFYFITMNDFFEALDNFVKDYTIDILITIPKHRSNSHSVFKVSHTKRLVYHSHIPILAAHE